MQRREFLGLLGAGAGLALADSVAAQIPAGAPAADAILHIAAAKIEIAPHWTVKTTAYNNAVPGPFLRFREGQRVTIDVFNDTKDPELTHWHGLWIPSNVDGSAEEGTPFIPPNTARRYSFVARPAGTRWYHTHVSAEFNLNRGTYSGQFGMLYIEPANDPGRYDLEIPLSLHEWEPYFVSKDQEIEEISYGVYSINDRALGHGEPIRVRQGQKVLFRILNASATLQHQIALAGHQFTVIALDGNPVPSPRPVDMLSLGPAERVDAVVTMNAPGVWVLGELDNNMRNRGLGVVVEYENRTEEPRWVAPEKPTWDYTVFGDISGNSLSPAAAASPTQAEMIPLIFTRRLVDSRFEQWMINGKPFPKADPILVRANGRYRLLFNNQSDDDHPIHLHRHSFELKNVTGTNTAGIFKDVVVVPARKTVEVELLANNPGETLFHCHNQMHMDFGFMTLMHYT